MRGKGSGDTFPAPGVTLTPGERDGQARGRRSSVCACLSFAVGSGIAACLVRRLSLRCSWPGMVSIIIIHPSWHAGTRGRLFSFARVADPRLSPTQRVQPRATGAGASLWVLHATEAALPEGDPQQSSYTICERLSLGEPEIQGPDQPLGDRGLRAGCDAAQTVCAADRPSPESELRQTTSLSATYCAYAHYLLRKHFPFYAPQGQRQVPAKLTEPPAASARPRLRPSSFHRVHGREGCRSPAHLRPGACLGDVGDGPSSFGLPSGAR